MNSSKLSSPLQIKCEALLKKFPLMKRAYHMKEMMTNIYEQTTREEAEAWYKHIKSMIINYMGVDEFLKTCATIDNWHNEVFNYFDQPFTNAATENINKMINAIGDAGRGYSFEVLRAKAIYKQDAKKTAKFTFADRE